MGKNSEYFVARYTKPKEGEWVKPVMKGYKMMCCDCGLIHRLDFRVKRWGRGFKVLFRAFRHVRATAAARRRIRAKETGD